MICTGEKVLALLILSIYSALHYHYCLFCASRKWQKVCCAGAVELKCSVWERLRQKVSTELQFFDELWVL